MKHLIHARKEAVKSHHERAKVGAVIVKGGAIIGKGFNSPKYIGKGEYGYTSTHAELSALLHTNKPKGGVCYVFRMLKNSLPAMAKPCMKCQTLLRHAGIKKAYYTTSIPPFFGVIKL